MKKLNDGTASLVVRHKIQQASSNTTSSQEQQSRQLCQAHPPTQPQLLQAPIKLPKQLPPLQGQQQLRPLLHRNSLPAKNLKPSDDCPIMTYHFLNPSRV